MLAKQKFPTIIIGYTTTSHLGDYYKRCIGRLTRSCVKFDLSHYVFPLEWQIDWATACALKIQVIKKALLQLNEPILWLDADAEIFRYPDVFESINTDFALCSQGGHWLTGTLYLSPAAMPLVIEWERHTINSAVDEVVLLHLYRNKTYTIRHKLLPSSYNVAIHTTSDLTEVVIGHHLRPDVAGSRGVIANQVPEL